MRLRYRIESQCPWSLKPFLHEVDTNKTNENRKPHKIQEQASLVLLPPSTRLGGSSSISLLDQELWSSARSSALVGQVRSSDDERASADKITSVAEDLGAVLGIAGDLSAVLEVLGVSEENDSSDLLTNTSVDVGDTGSGESSTLAVTSSDENSIRTLLVSVVEVAQHLTDSSARSSARKSVVTEGSTVSTANALDPDTVPAVLGLEL